MAVCDICEDETDHLIHRDIGAPADVCARCNDALDAGAKTAKGYGKFMKDRHERGDLVYGPLKGYPYS